ncbi:hypothetical protein SKAU_G00069600 [Synaphobranchus kaupii]|uniref:Uncharacterized protein n=1 Tax=Synaphobranchus kaupii TaxID=118154 RepID=A0A9Q1JBK7_SYNKA|nr:hypothetical protein SKAU_G00069600 [Synaphobranchus kaupii]
MNFPTKGEGASEGRFVLPSPPNRRRGGSGDLTLHAHLRACNNSCALFPNPMNYQDMQTIHHCPSSTRPLILLRHILQRPNLNLLGFSFL